MSESVKVRFVMAQSTHFAIEKETTYHGGMETQMGYEYFSGGSRFTGHEFAQQAGCTTDYWGRVNDLIVIDDRDSVLNKVLLEASKEIP